MPKLDLSLTPEELDAFLSSERTLRLATVSAAGEPHVVPLWFVWVESAVFLNSTLGNATLRNLERDPRAAATVDDGVDYDELRGVVIRGRVQRVDDDPGLAGVEDAWSRKYLGGSPVPFRRWNDRVWLRLTPERVRSWDFRKMAEARARRAANG